MDDNTTKGATITLEITDEDVTLEPVYDEEGKLTGFSNRFHYFNVTSLYPSMIHEFNKSSVADD